MRVRRHRSPENGQLRGFTVWLSSRDTYNWSRKPGAVWPCSTLADRRVVACFDSTGIVELAINNRDDADCDSNELNAMLADLLPADCREFAGL